METPEAIVAFPNDEGTEFCEKAMHKRHSSLKNVCCFADGLKLDFEACEDLEEHAMDGHTVTVSPTFWFFCIAISSLGL